MYAAYDRASGFALFIRSPRGMLGTLSEVWAATRRTGNIGIARIENGAATTIYLRGLGWDEHVPTGRPITYR